MQINEDRQYQEKVLELATKMRQRVQEGRSITSLLDEIATVALGGNPGFELSEDGKTMLVDGRRGMYFTQKGFDLIENRVRRDWAKKIYEEFEPHHDHSGDGECGACGAKAAADFMNPDHFVDLNQKEETAT